MENQQTAPAAPTEPQVQQRSTPSANASTEPPKNFGNEAKQQQSPTAGVPTQQKKSSGKGTAAVVVILAILILGAGGYYYSKYVQKKNTQKSTTINATTTASVAAGTVSVESIITALLYPKATIADQRQDSASVYKAELTLNAPDDVATIKNYYLKLAKDKSWTISRQGTVGENNFYLTVADGVFEAEIEATKYDGYDTTDIGINISGESLISTGILISPTAVQSSGASTAVATKTSTTSTNSSDYIISNSDTGVITESELTSLTPWQLKVARNEIYARHGREFVHKDLQCYFAKKSWYKIDSGFNESSLSTTENKNVATIKTYEDETSSPLASEDSGCDTNQ